MTTLLEHQHEIDEERFDRATFGFWVYLMTDCILFACLFATYIVLHNNTNGGPSSKALFDLPYILSETLILLSSSFTVGIAALAMEKNKSRKTILWLLSTFILGALFLYLELNEFKHLVHEGNSWTASGFLSGYFTLVGTHGAHILAGLIAIAVMIGQIIFHGITPSTFRRVTCVSMFWHFLDLIWIFIFTIVYLMGVI